MTFEWDDVKARANYRKHRIHFADAIAILEDGSAITIPDDDSLEEERFVSVGRDGFGRLLVVVYTWRGLNIRLISARKANRREIQDYGN